MQQGFRPEHEQGDYIPPDLAEQVIERFAERERLRQAERERLATMTHVNDLAELLGTTPDDVSSLATEVQRTKKPPVIRHEPATDPVVHANSSNWQIHAIYLSLIFLLLVGSISVIRSRPTAPPSAPPVFNPPPPWTSIDPPGSFRQGELLSPLIDKSVVAPPAGFAVKLKSPFGTKLALGTPGSLADQASAAKQLKSSILSILAYQESLSKVTGTITQPDYTTPLYQSSVGQSPGWHLIEVNTGRNLAHVALPDKRYAKDLAAYKKTLEYRLAWFLDTKLFPDLKPGHLRAEATRLDIDLPYGTALMIFDDRKTVYAMGSKGIGVSKDSMLLKNQLDTALGQAYQHIKEKDLFPESPPKQLEIMLVFPGGEERRSFSLANDPQQFGSLIGSITIPASLHVATLNGNSNPYVQTFAPGPPAQYERR